MNKRHFFSISAMDGPRRFLISVLSLFLIYNVYSQETKTLAELLGYPSDSKLLIIHADDMGLAHSVNTACIKAFGNKGVTSGSIMVPCPWSLEILKYAADHQDMDAGIHLTMTAEWNLYKWDGVSSSDQISSLLDTDGYFYPTVEAFGKAVKPEEAAREMRAQIDKVIRSGIHVSHIDTHMGSVLATPELVNIYLSLSDEYNLPVLFPRAYTSLFPPETAKSLNSRIFLIDNLFMLEPGMIKGNWIDPYRQALKEMKPGLNQMIVHLAEDNDEMKAISVNHDDYGSAWRQKDLDLVLSQEFKNLIKENNIILIGWREISNLMRQQKSANVDTNKN
jgi:predicted glycoside hydrolase/deacetylase ChbG (UPF0249 family)